MFGYWFIMTCISLTAPPNCTPYLPPCFPVGKYGPWMSLKEERCFVMTELESCECVLHCLHKLLSLESSPYWVTLFCKKKGRRGGAACEERWSLVTQWRKGHDAPLHTSPAKGRLLSMGSQEEVQVRSSWCGWGIAELRMKALPLLREHELGAKRADMLWGAWQAHCRSQPTRASSATCKNLLWIF